MTFFSLLIFTHLLIYFSQGTISAPCLSPTCRLALKQTKNNTEKTELLKKYIFSVLGEWSDRPNRPLANEKNSVSGGGDRLNRPTPPLNPLNI